MDIKGVIGKTADVCECLIEYSGRLLSWLILCMVLMTFGVVLLRYGFNIGWIGMQESVIYLHALLFMLAAAYAFKHENHVRVDIFYNNFSPKRKALIDLSGNILLLIPATLFIFISGLEYAGRSWAIHETSAEAGGLPYVYLLKSIIPLAACLLLIQAVAGTLRNAVSLYSGDPMRNERHK